MRLIYFTKYNRNGASSRLRSFQYFELLEAKGFNIKVYPFFSNKYLQNKYSKSSNLFVIIYSYIKRFFQLFSIRKGDVLFIEYELFPYFFSIFEWVLYVMKFHYIVDYDDAIFHNYDLSKNPILKYLLGKKIDRVMRDASVVTVGNEYLASRARSAGSKNIVLLPTVVDINRYTCKIEEPSNSITIGWIGSPSTSKYVEDIEKVLYELSEDYKVNVIIIGANPKFDSKINYKYIPWDEETEVQSILQMDIGIMPLDNSSWSKGKCGYKLIQYMACGIPVVASPVGVNAKIVKHDINGFLASTKEEWIHFLSLLIKNKTMRKNMGREGRINVETNYSLEKGGLIVTSLINGLNK